MLEAVFAFGMLLAAFELVVLGMIPPKYRLRLLGSRGGCIALHCTVFVLNLWVHWGTIIGTMSATASFVASMLTVTIARVLWGAITDNVRVKRGLFGFRNEELIL